MKRINNIRQEWKHLDQEGKEFFKAILVFFIPISCFLIWLASTNTYPTIDAKTTDSQTESNKTYELPKFYNKYAQHCYDYNN